MNEARAHDSSTALFGGGGLLAQLAEGLGDGIWTIDREGKTTFVNSAMAVLLGCAASKCLGGSFEESVHREDQAELRALVDSPVGREAEVRLVPGDGPPRPVRVQAVPARDADGAPGGAIMVVKDVAHLGQAHLAQARLAAIIESSDDAIVSKDLNGVVQTWNRGAQRIFGYTAEEMVGRPILTLIPPDRHHEEDTVLSTLRAGGRVDHFETVRVTKDGRFVDISVTVSPIRDASGRIVGASKVARDITDAATIRRERERMRAELEDAVRARTADLQAAVREMEGFTYTIAHDLRAPLRAIDATSHTLLEDFGEGLPPEAHEELHRQSAAARRMGRLIDDLLKLSRLGRQPLAIGPVDLSASVAAALRNLGFEDRPDGVRVEVQPGMALTADARLMELVMQNLLENALKFSPAGGTVRVSQAEGGTVAVSDEGIGFDMAYADKLFEPFHRLVPDEAYPGTGIGLTNVKRIVERHGGRVWAESAPGQGATFRFTLAPPATDDARAA